jgi:hypothetical protein
MAEKQFNIAINVNGQTDINKLQQSLKQSANTVTELESKQAALEEAFKSVRIGTREYALLADELQRVNSRLANIDESVADITAAEKVEGFVRFGSAIGGIGASLSAVTTAFGGTSEEVEKLNQKIGAFIVVLETLLLITEALGKENKLFTQFLAKRTVATEVDTIAVNANTAATKANNDAIKGKGINLKKSGDAAKQTTDSVGGLTSSIFGLSRAALGWIGVAVALIGGIVLLIKNFDNLRRSFNGFTDSVVSGFNAITDFIGLTNKASRESSKLVDTLKELEEVQKLVFSNELLKREAEFYKGKINSIEATKALIVENEKRLKQEQDIAKAEENKLKTSSEYNTILGDIAAIRAKDGELQSRIDKQKAGRDKLNLYQLEFINKLEKERANNNATLIKLQKELALLQADSQTATNNALKTELELLQNRNDLEASLLDIRDALRERTQEYLDDRLEAEEKIDILNENNYNRRIELTNKLADLEKASIKDKLKSINLEEAERIRLNNKLLDIERERVKKVNDYQKELFSANIDFVNQQLDISANRLNRLRPITISGQKTIADTLVSIEANKARNQAIKDAFVNIPLTEELTKKIEDYKEAVKTLSDALNNTTTRVIPSNVDSINALLGDIEKVVEKLADLGDKGLRKLQLIPEPDATADRATLDEYNRLLIEYGRISDKEKLTDIDILQQYRLLFAKFDINKVFEETIKIQNLAKIEDIIKAYEDALRINQRLREAGSLVGNNFDAFVDEVNKRADAFGVQKLIKGVNGQGGTEFRPFDPARKEYAALLKDIEKTDAALVKTTKNFRDASEEGKKQIRDINAKLGTALSVNLTNDQRKAIQDNIQLLIAEKKKLEEIAVQFETIDQPFSKEEAKEEAIVDARRRVEEAQKSLIDSFRAAGIDKEVIDKLTDFMNETFAQQLFNLNKNQELAMKESALVLLELLQNTINLKRLKATVTLDLELTRSGRSFLDFRDFQDSGVSQKLIDDILGGVKGPEGLGDPRKVDFLRGQLKGILDDIAKIEASQAELIQTSIRMVDIEGNIVNQVDLAKKIKENEEEVVFLQGKVIDLRGEISKLADQPFYLTKRGKEYRAFLQQAIKDTKEWRDAEVERILSAKVLEEQLLQFRITQVEKNIVDKQKLEEGYISKVVALSLNKNRTAQEEKELQDLLNKSTQEALALLKERVDLEIQLSNIDAKTEDEIAAVDRQANQATDSMKKLIEEQVKLNEIINASNQLASSLTELYGSFSEIVVDKLETDLERLTKVLEAIDKQIDETQSRIDATNNELKEARGFRRKELLNELEGERARLAALQAQRDANAKKEEENKKRIEASEKRLQQVQAVSNTIQQVGLAIAAIKQAFTNPASLAFSLAAAAATVTAVTAGVKAISTFEDGGMLEGPLHSQGGIKGKGAFGNVEVEGGEFIVNRKSTERYRGLLEAINKDKYANGGVLAPTVQITNDTDKKILALQESVLAIANRPVQVAVTDINEESDRLSKIVEVSQF